MLMAASSIYEHGAVGTDIGGSLQILDVVLSDILRRDTLLQFDCAPRSLDDLL